MISTNESFSDIYQEVIIQVTDKKQIRLRVMKYNDKLSLDIREFHKFNADSDVFYGTKKGLFQDIQYFKDNVLQPLNDICNKYTISNDKSI